MSVSIKISHAIKRYGNQTIIPDLSLTVQKGEFFTLLGPSGCGKTTLLRMIAGFNSIEGGTIQFGDRIINTVHPSQRNIGMVFQNYAIFPHMTVAQNVAFGLTNRGISKEEIQRRVDEILKVVQIDNLKNRYPHNMSGGQQQRIALARAIVIHPDVLLMDEPLSNLDAKLRIEMRNAIREIQHNVGITTIYVTHDQEEALAISDRIGVMHNGHLEHVGTPRNVYQHPANHFVAGFIGRSNDIPARYCREGTGCRFEFDGGYGISANYVLPGLADGSDVQVSVRPEEFTISREGEGIAGVVEDSIFLGLNTHFFVRLANSTSIEVLTDDIDDHIPNSSKIRLRLKENRINVFSADGSVNLISGVQNDAEE